MNLNSQSSMIAELKEKHGKPYLEDGSMNYAYYMARLMFQKIHENYRDASILILDPPFQLSHIVRMWLQ